MAYTLDYSGCAVCVVGGTSGIGLGVAETFARAGARVAVLGRDPQKLRAARAKLGASAAGRAVDVRDAAAVADAFAALGQELGPLDVVVSAAAGNFPARAIDMTARAFKAVIDIDLLGSFHVAQAAYAALRRPSGSLIHISAPQAILAMALQSHVCAAKAGVDMLTRTLALEWAAEGLRVNSIVPGPIEGTEGMARLAPGPEAMERVRASVPLGRLGAADEIGRAALWLASAQAAYVTGVVLPVDGGWSLGGAAQLAETMAAGVRESGKTP